MLSDRYIPAVWRNLLSSSQPNLKTEETGSFEMLVVIYFTACCHITEHCELLVHRVVTGIMTELAWRLSHQSSSFSHNTQKNWKTAFTNSCYISLCSGITATVKCARVYSTGNNKNHNDTHQ